MDTSAPLPIIYRSVPRFVQGPGILAGLGSQVSALCPGARVCLLLDPGVPFLRDTLERSLAAGGLPFAVREFDGSLFVEDVDRLAERIRAQDDPQLVIGVGSGKTIDLSKMLAHRLGARNMVVATASATDAACSHAAVGVDERGHIRPEAYARSPELVLVDTEVIARAPARLFASGIGDAISKRHEMRTAAARGESNFGGGRPPHFIAPLADVLHETLLSRSLAALAEVRRQTPGPALEEVTSACLLLSTLVWENGGLAGAHSVANVLFNSGCCRQALHGEQVAFGLFLQLELEENRGELESLQPLYAGLGLPSRLSALGSGLSGGEALRGIAESIHQRWRKHSIAFSTRQILASIERLERP